jgi:hypothetical protein
MTKRFHDFTEYSIRGNGGATVSHYHMTGLDDGRYCRIYPRSDGHGWERKTRNHSMHGIRYEWYPTLDEAFAASLKWAHRKEAEDARETRKA